VSVFGFGAATDGPEQAGEPADDGPAEKQVDDKQQGDGGRVTSGADDCRQEIAAQSENARAANPERNPIGDRAQHHWHWGRRRADSAPLSTLMCGYPHHMLQR
jgi:hypothetical protein